MNKRTIYWVLIPWIICAAYLFGFQYPAAMDMPNHTARSHIMNLCLGGVTGGICDEFAVKFLPITYFLPDYSIAIFLKIFSNFYTAGEFALFVVLTLNLFGWYRLCKVVRGELTAAYIAGLPLLFNNFFYKGYYAYLLGNGALLFWIAAWWPHRDAQTLRASLKISLGLVVLYACHLAAFFSAALIFSSYALWKFLWTENRTKLIRSYIASSWPFVLTLIGLYTFQEIVTEAAFNKPEGAQAWASGPSIVEWFSAKLVGLAYATINHSKYFDCAIFGLSVVACLASVNRKRLNDRSNYFWLLCFGCFIGAYFVTPNVSHGAIDVDLRFLLPGFYALFLGLGAFLERRPLPHLLLTLLVFAQLALNLVFRVEMEAILGKMASALDKTEPGKKLVEINSISAFPLGKASRVNAFSHFGTYYMLRGGAMVDGLLNCYMNPNIPYFCYRHQNEANSLFKYQFSGLPALSSEEISSLHARFDYFLVVEPDAGLVASMMSSSQFDQLYHDGYVYLFSARH
jgi:hypothetical protein